MTPEDRIAELEAENAALRVQLAELPVLREQLAALAAEVQELRGSAATAAIGILTNRPLSIHT